MKGDREILYTEAAKERMEKLRRDFQEMIEDELRRRKYVPGDERIEVTGSDIEELNRATSINFRGRYDSRNRYRKLVIQLYMFFGILLTCAGIFYPYVRTMIMNPMQAALVLMGVSISLASYFLSRYFEVFDRRTREKDFFVWKGEIEKSPGPFQIPAQQQSSPTHPE